jgi:hypothetical protein
MFEEREPFAAGDAFWVDSVEYPPTVGDGSGYEFWVIDGALRAAQRTATVARDGLAGGRHADRRGWGNHL